MIPIPPELLIALARILAAHAAMALVPAFLSTTAGAYDGLLDAQGKRVAAFLEPVSKGVIALIVPAYLWQVLRPRGRKAQARDRT